LKNYNIIERLLVLVAETSIRTITLLDWFNRYGDENMEVIEYQIYIVQKKIEQGGCDTREHFDCINSGDYFLNIKSLKSSDNNCGIGIFTNTLKIKLQPNILRKTLKIPLGVQLNFEHMQILSDFFKNDICVYKKIEDGFEIIFETNDFDKPKIETLLIENHYWLVLSHNIKKNYGTCVECGEENIKISDHKCDYDLIVKNQEKICECGKDIGKMSHQQIEMHMRSKYHNENI
jgi:hypothetical protein